MIRCSRYFAAAAFVPFIINAGAAPQEPVATAPESKPASQPASAPARAKLEWPVEIDADRVPRIHTGGNVLITDVNVIPVTTPMLEHASILIRNGKITAIGQNLSVPEGTTTIDGRGWFAVPGAIDCHSHIAIEGDVNEGGDAITAECRISDVIDPNSLEIYRALAGGCTTARLLHGSANAIGGQHAIIKLKTHRTAAGIEMADAPRGIKFALGENPKQSNFRAPGRPLRYPTTRMGVEALIRRSFDEANDLIKERRDDLEKIAKGGFVPPRRRDLRLETIVAILAGEVAVHSHCYRADEITMLLDVADAYGVKIKTLQHVLEGYKVAPEIARHGAGASTFSDWWAFKMEAYDAIPYNVALMTRAGVNVTINSDSGELIRRLHLDAGKAMRYGMLTADECLATVSINTAKQLGIDKRLGSIEVGKDGDIALFDAHPLSVEAKCMMSIVDGEVEFQRRDAWIEYINDVKEELKLNNLSMHSQRTGAARMEFASTTPWAPAPKVAAQPAEKIAIIRGTVVPVTSPAFVDGTVLIENGAITALGPGLPAPSDYKVIDAKGLYIYPGMIDAISRVGLAEVGSVAGTDDAGESDSLQPDLLTWRAVHAESEHIPVARANGITSALVSSSGGLLGGQSALVHLDGWTTAHMLVVDRLAMHVDFPSQYADDPEKSAADNDKEREKNYKTSTRELKLWIERAAAYGADPAKNVKDPKLDALAPYASGTRPFIMNIGGARDAVGAARFAEENKLKIILRSSCNEIGKVAVMLAEKKIPVLLLPVTSVPSSPFAPYDTIYSAARVLDAAGVLFAFGMADSSNARNLPFQAGMSAAYGLPMDAAIRSVTINAAKILGVDEKLGSLEPGKIADIIITDGNPLEVRTHVKRMIVGGRETNLESKHTQLYEKYLNRLTPDQRKTAGAPR
ncbi:MAG: amidohydrolase family protein [Planctomycetes bacterium]|nr:amidohydrolase family protein [Planctomycetota bacterium]